jgi:cytochrome c6
MVTTIPHPPRRRWIDLLAMLLAAMLALVSLLLWPGAAHADGAGLFGQHCAGCHINGGNIIRRGRTLRLQALERQGLDSSAAIAAIAADGLGQMSGYGAVLGEQGVQQVADFVWQQAQLGWPRP